MRFLKYAGEIWISAENQRDFLKEVVENLTLDSGKTLTAQQLRYKIEKKLAEFIEGDEKDGD